MKLRIESRAELDVAEAALWYEEQRPGIGADFLDAVDRLTESIRRNPERYAISAAATVRRQYR